jgi:hypothetical protein
MFLQPQAVLFVLQEPIRNTQESLHQRLVMLVLWIHIRTLLGNLHVFTVVQINTHQLQVVLQLRTV